MERSDTQYVSWLRWRDHLQDIHEIVFALNLSCALGYAFLVYVLQEMTSEAPQNDTGYYFLRAAVRVKDLLHLNSASAVTTNAVARQSQGRWGQVGEELTILISILSVTIILLLILRLISKTRAYRVIMDRLALVTALWGAPACYLCMSKITWQSEVPCTFWRSPLFAMFIGEILCFGALLLVHRLRLISVATLIVLLIFHYVIWVGALWIGIPGWLHTLLAVRLLLAVFPLSGLVWLLSFRQGKSAAEKQSVKRQSKWIPALAFVCLALLAALWLPRPVHSLLRSKDLKSTTIEIARGPCYGMCPSYRALVQGTGSVEYVGYRYVKTKERQTAVLTNEQLKQILEKLDRSHFFDIEDRAFTWCFDTPSVEVSVSSGGKTKRVSSDAGCTGAKSGTQAKFVQLANEIEAILDIDQWIKCDGYCRN